jgi:hypothetical protein
VVHAQKPAAANDTRTTEQASYHQLHFNSTLLLNTLVFQGFIRASTGGKHPGGNPLHQIFDAKPHLGFGETYHMGRRIFQCAKTIRVAP